MTDPGASDDPSDGGPETAPGRSRSRKAPHAFRTISEVADELQIPQHVLRFWETKFPQVHPLKRGGGRRYYRPDDIALLRRISGLLYVHGYTIKGVQRLLREGGGRLADDIPPPPADERAGGEEESEGPDDQLAMPGLLPAKPVPPPAMRTTRPQLDPEAARLRAVLELVLQELERLRALLR